MDDGDPPSLQFSVVFPMYTFASFEGTTLNGCLTTSLAVSYC